LSFRSISRVLLPLCGISLYAAAIPIDLGTASSFAVLAGSKVTNTGATVINGNLGLWPGSSVTGLPLGLVNGTIEVDNSIAMQALSDLTAAYNFAAGEVCGIGNNLTDQDLGGLTLTPGVYCFMSSAQLTGLLTLDAQGDPGALFIFQIGSTLTTASNSSVTFANNGNGGGVFWQIGSSATLGTGTEFAGSILAFTDITLTTGANITDGRALARNGAVTLDTNNVSVSPTPEPGTSMFIAMGLLLGVVGFRGRMQKAHQQRKTAS
jgi:hypothetical protein